MENEFEFSPESSSIEQPVTTPAEEPATLPETVPAEPICPVPEIPVQASVPVAPAAPAPAPKKARNGVWIALAIVAICVALAMGVVAILAAAPGWSDEPAPGGNNDLSIQQPSGEDFDIPQSNTPSYNYRDDVQAGDELTPQEIIKKVSPSVVTVMVEGPTENGQLATGFGTGIIYTDNGYILTNAHVVEGATSIYVTDYEGKDHKAALVGYDSDSDTAVIKISATGLTPAEFGKSSELVPGDTVIAIGTPYDMNLSYTATQGIVSALRESLNFPELGYTLDLIQHDAAINSGNSGGPLVNVYGQVVGINSIKISGTFENLGFALQIDDVLPLAEELMKNGKVSRPGIGITGYTYDDGTMKGAYVYTVVEGGPADKAGLKAGDIIIKAGDTEITSIDELKSILQAGKIGDSVTLTYVRNNAIHTTQLVLEELNAQ